MEAGKPNEFRETDRPKQAMVFPERESGVNGFTISSSKAMSEFNQRKRDKR